MFRSLVVLLVLAAFLGAQAPVQFLNLMPGSGPAGSSFPGMFTELNGFLYFAGTTPNYGSELMRTDGTAAGTTVVRDLWPGGTGSDSMGGITGDVITRIAGNGSNHPGFAVRTGLLIFAAFGTPSNPADLNYYLWRSDGTAAGTQPIVQTIGISNGDVLLTELNGNWLFPGYSFSGGNPQLYGTNGTNVFSLTGSVNYYFNTNEDHRAVIGNKLYFAAYSPTLASEIFETDGVTVSLALDVSPGSGNGDPRNFVVGETTAGPTLFFTAHRPDVGQEVFSWRPGNAPVAYDLVPGSGSSYVSSFGDGLVPFRDGALCSVTFSHRSELIYLDGTTWSAFHTFPQGSGLYADRLTPLNEFVALFRAGGELWRTDGTSAGTVPLSQFGAGSGWIYDLTVLDGRAYFIADDSGGPNVFGLEPWTSDGTPAGTHIIEDTDPGPGVPMSYFVPANWTRFGDRIVFAFGNDGIGIELASVAAPPTLLLSLSQPSGSGSLLVENAGLTPGVEMFNVWSIPPCAGGAGTGPYLGLCNPDVNFLLAQVMLPVGTPPFHYIATNPYQAFGPISGFSTVFTFDAVCFEWLPGNFVGRVSDVKRLTVQ